MGSQQTGRSSMIEYACKDLVFHFNKKHLEDETIPMWVVKTKGETFYVNHVECTVPWSTKETPDNASTKGSIKVKDCLLTIDNENGANVTKLTPHDKIRLHNAAKGITRIITSWVNKGPVESAIKQSNVKHGPFKKICGRCGSLFFVTEIMNKSDLTMLTLSANDKFRILMPNEKQYEDYDDPTHDPDWYYKQEEDAYDEDEDQDSLGTLSLSE